ncbi:hypothetical protein HK105_208081 [Polyrhizophydium stewartii]|uniref:Uncharacterized protein n=1 Tax=Polyrhizophydium stewartii TaxID=2732419 RepID=A0ABR4MYU4_9FUNG
MDSFAELEPSATNAVAAGAALAQFVAAHSAVMGLVAEQRATAEQKARWTAALLRALALPAGTASPAWPASVTALALQALRILARERTACDAVYEPAAVGLLAAHAGIAAGDKFAESPVAVEALKCLSNVLLQDAPARSAFGDSPSVADAALALQSPDCGVGAVFLLARLVFLGTVGNRDASARVVKLGVCDRLAHFLTALHTRSMAVRPDEAWISEPVVVNEILKTAFNLSVSIAEINTATGSMPTIFGGPRPAAQRSAADNPEREVMARPFVKLLEAIIDVYMQVPFADLPLLAPHSHAIHFMMNVPVKPFNASWFAKYDHAIVSRTVDALHATFLNVFPRPRPKKAGSSSAAANPSDSDGDEEYLAEIDGVNVEQALPPILILMRNWANEDARARAMLKSLLMPDNLDRSKPLGKGTGLTNYLISFMSSVSMLQIRDCVCELLLSACGDNVGELVTYVGYGNAAGFLMNRGIMAPPGGADADASTGPSINPITGEFVRDEPRVDPFEGMTDEEKEREAERLFVLFDRLQKTGVVKVVPKQD